MVRNVQASVPVRTLKARTWPGAASGPSDRRYGHHDQILIDSARCVGADEFVLGFLRQSQAAGSHARFRQMIRLLWPVLAFRAYNQGPAPNREFACRRHRPSRSRPGWYCTTAGSRESAKRQSCSARGRIQRHDLYGSGGSVQYPIHDNRVALHLSGGIAGMKFPGDLQVLYVVGGNLFERGIVRPVGTAQVLAPLGGSLGGILNKIDK